MSVSDAQVRAYCDRCTFGEEVIELTATAGRSSYDMRNIRADLLALGWQVSADLSETICPSCAEDELEVLGMRGGRDDCEVRAGASR